MPNLIGSNIVLSNVNHPKKYNSARDQIIGGKPFNDQFEHLIDLAEQEDFNKVDESENATNNKFLPSHSADVINIEHDLAEKLDDADQIAEDTEQVNKAPAIIFAPIPLKVIIDLVNDKPDIGCAVDDKLDAAFNVDGKQDAAFTVDNNLSKAADELVYNQVAAPVPSLKEFNTTSSVEKVVPPPVANHIDNRIAPELLDEQFIDMPAIVNLDKASKAQTAFRYYSSTEEVFEAMADSNFASQASDDPNSQSSENSSDDSLFSHAQFNIQQARQNQTITGQPVVKISEQKFTNYATEQLDGASGIKSNDIFEANKRHATSLTTASLHSATTDRAVVAEDSAIKITNFNTPIISQNIGQTQLAQTTFISLRQDDKELFADILDSLEQRAMVVDNDNKLSISFKQVAANAAENIPPRFEQITMAVRMATQQGKNQISLTMYPESLGSVDIAIEFNQTGEVASIKVYAEKPETLRLLIRDYGILERSLNEVVKADDASLSFNLKDGQGGNNNDQSSSDRRSTPIPTKEGEAEGKIYNVTVKPSSNNRRNHHDLAGVDIRV